MDNLRPQITRVINSKIMFFLYSMTLVRHMRIKNIDTLSLSLSLPRTFILTIAVNYLEKHCPHQIRHCVAVRLLQR